MTYTYDPTQIIIPGKDKMRFELGDVNVSGEGQNAAICDEEIIAMLTLYGTRWRMAKCKIVESIYHRFSYEVTFAVDSSKVELQARTDHWKGIYEDMRKQVVGLSAPITASSSTTESSTGDGGHYFKAGLQGNPLIDNIDAYNGSGRPI